MYKLSYRQRQTCNKLHQRVSTDVPIKPAILSPKYHSLKIPSIGCKKNPYKCQSEPSFLFLVDRHSINNVIPYRCENRGSRVQSNDYWKREVELGPGINETLETHDAVSDELPFVVILRAEGKVDSSVSCDDVADRHCGEPSDDSRDSGVEFPLIGEDKTQCDEGRPSHHHCDGYQIPIYAIYSIVLLLIIVVHVINVTTNDICINHYYCFFLSQSLSFINKVPNLFWPLPLPPSAQYLSFFVCSTNLMFFVQSSLTKRSLFWVNLWQRPSYITFSFTSDQSSRRGMLAFLPNLKAQAGVSVQMMSCSTAFPSNFFDWKQCSFVVYFLLLTMNSERQKLLRKPCGPSPLQNYITFRLGPSIQYLFCSILSKNNTTFDINKVDFIKEKYQICKSPYFDHLQKQVSKDALYYDCSYIQLPFSDYAIFLEKSQQYTKIQLNSIVNYRKRLFFSQKYMEKIECDRQLPEHSLLELGSQLQCGIFV